MKKSYANNILVLVADSNEENRAHLSHILDSHGYFPIQAVNAGAAIKVLEDWDVDVAIMAHKMAPHDGFEIARHILVKGKKVGTVMVTDNPTTDLLIEAGKYQIGQVMRLPVDPDRLTMTVRRMARKRGKNPDALTADQIKHYTPDELMRRAIALANQNARSGMGGPFGAIVADEHGHILGEGVNGVSARCDPTAHAEVLAIRRATEKLNKPRLDGCVIYCSSEPTMMGQALIIGTGIDKVYYGLSHSEAGTVRANDEGIVGEMAKPLGQRSVPYEQLQHDEAFAVFKSWQSQAEKVGD